MPKKKSPNSVRLRNSTAEFLTFAYQTGGDGVEVRVENGTIWLSQKNMGDLFMTSSDNIGLHLKNIFKEGELIAALVTEEFSVTATDGKNYTVRHYNLDAIIAVGYRVNSSAPRLSGNGPRESCGTTRSVGMCWFTSRTYMPKTNWLRWHS